MYNAAEYPQGVPNPYRGEVNVYPSYEHGPDYTRPVFGQPFEQMPYNRLSGLGVFAPLEEYAEEQRAKERLALYKGVGAAATFGLVLAALVGARGRSPGAMVQASVAFGITGLVAAGVTYYTWPRPEWRA